MARKDRATRSTGATPALELLTARGVDHALHPYDHAEGETRFGEEVVAALGVPAERVLKTVVTDCSGELVVAVVAVAQQVDLKALAAAVGAKKAAVAAPAAAERSSGYVVGGISPLGQRTPLRTVVDEAAMQHERVLVSAGRRGLQVELSPTDLVALTGAVVARVGR